VIAFRDSACYRRSVDFDADAEEGEMTNPSGADVPSEKVQIVLAHLRAEFPVEEILHDPQGDQLADRYRIVRNGEVAHTLLVRRKFYDDNPELGRALAAVNAAGKMRAGARQVDLG
jgi:hypothetical protein